MTELIGEHLEDFAILHGPYNESVYFCGRISGYPGLLGWEKRISLLSVCREIYYETRFLPYSLNRFRTSGAKNFDKWVSALGLDKRSVIKVIFLSVATHFCIEDELDKVPAILDRLTSLEVIVCSQEPSFFNHGSILPFEIYVAKRGLKLVIDDQFGCLAIPVN